MADAERVVFTLGTTRKRREAVFLLDSCQTVPAAGQHFVRIGLMPDVPDQTVIRCLEHVMQRNGQFHRPESGGEMATHLTDRVDQEGA